jgi:aspartyl-tRNA(Asn)/glutamyl-tRNA(Gln) amidotransferase subunit A
VSASDEIAALTAGELTANYKAGALTPLEATLAIFARIERLNPLYNAFALM